MSSMNPLRVVVVWCPDWPIVAAVTAGLLPDGTPVALIDRGEVVACSIEARRNGVRRGLRLREAQARCPELATIPYDPVADARAFDPIVAVIEERVPGVQVLRSGLATVRARGAARYYRGEDRAASELLGALGRFTAINDARIGIADGIFAAEQAAYRTAPHQRTLIVPTGASPQFLAPLPIDALSTSSRGEPKLVPLLKRLGAGTLGDFAALNETDVRARFGEGGARAHAQAAGRDPRPVTARVPEKDFDQVALFEPPLDRIETVAFAFRSAADSFVAGITTAKLVCTAIRVVVDTESGASSEREWAHPRHFTAAEVLDRVRWQLQGAGGELASPVTRVRVSPVRVDAIGNHEAGLWGHAPDERIHHGLSRIQSMLGHDAVLTAVAGGGRMLAERRVLVPWGDAPPASAVATATRPWPGSLPDPPPATVFEQLQPVQVLDAAGTVVEVDARGTVSAPPAWLCQSILGQSVSGQSVSGQSVLGQSVSGQAGGDRRAVTHWAGPWPLQQRWWDAARSRRATRFQLVDERGEAWLVLRENDRWWAEARYD
ncbi:DNA polymerase Y family protein [Homoserinimonas sp. A520]